MIQGRAKVGPLALALALTRTLTVTPALTLSLTLLETTPCAPPCVYVYELPPRMNVLAMKAEPQWGK